jgi:hypothetical protein
LIKLVIKSEGFFATMQQLDANNNSYAATYQAYSKKEKIKDPNN